MANSPESLLDLSKFDPETLKALELAFEIGKSAEINESLTEAKNRLDAAWEACLQGDPGIERSWNNLWSEP